MQGHDKSTFYMQKMTHFGNGSSMFLVLSNETSRQDSKRTVGHPRRGH